MFRHRLVPGFVLLVVAWLASASLAVAHAELVTAAPAPDSTVEVAPTELTATFSEALDGPKSSLEVRDAGGTVIASGKGDSLLQPDGVTMILPLPALANGTYEVRWTSAAEDGHIERGTFAFTVAVPPSPSPSPSPAASARPVPSPSPVTSPSPAASPAPSASGDGGRRPVERRRPRRRDPAADRGGRRGRGRHRRLVREGPRSVTVAHPRARRPGRIARVLAAASLALALAACGPGDSSAVGVVVAVDPSGTLDVSEFTLRTASGESLVFSVGTLELDSGAFPAGHLRQHLATSQPIAVAFRMEDGVRVAHRMVDAPWYTP